MDKIIILNINKIPIEYTSMRILFTNKFSFYFLKNKELTTQQ